MRLRPWSREEIREIIFIKMLDEVKTLVKGDQRNHIHQDVG
jgi:hypothetical protein